MIADGAFTLEQNASITVNGGSGSSHSDGSGAGGSGGAVRIEATSITNLGKIEAKGGDALGDTSLAGAGGGGRIALLSEGSIVEGDTNASGGRNLSISQPNYRSNDLVAYWTLDENASSSTAVNVQGNTSLNGVISGSPERRAGKKGGAFYFDGDDDKITVSYNDDLAVEEYTVAMWYFPERNNEWWTGLFGRGNGTEGRIHSIWQGASSHGTRPFFHHRFGEGTNWNEGVPDYYVSQWKKWYHIVFTNSGLSGKYARTYVNGSFASGTQRYERRVLNELMIDYTSNLYIGAAPDHGNGGYFKGIIDDVRLYRKGFGSEDVYHLYLGDPEVVDFEEPRMGAKHGKSGSFVKVESPTLPSISVPVLTYGEEVKGLDLGQSSTLSYAISGLPPGLSNEIPFSPAEIPGLFAWYDADSSGSLVEHEVKSYEHNLSVAQDNLLVYLPFDDDNGSVAFDYSGNGHHGRLIDQAQWTTEGKSGGALSFDGNNDGLAFEKVAYMDRPDAFTISFWFKRNNEMLGIPTNHQIDNLMVAQSSSYDNDNLEIGSEGSEIEIYLDSGGGNEDARYSTSGADIRDDTWHHLVVTYGNGLKVFVDGTERLNRTPYNGLLDSSQDSPLSLGMGRIFSDQWGDFNGSIDDFRIYSVEVDSAEVASLYNAGTGDFGPVVDILYDSARIQSWKDKSINRRDAESSYETAPTFAFDPLTSKKMVSFDYGKSLRIPEGATMPITAFLVGYETGATFPDRELFTFEGWRMIHNGRWGLRRWSDNNPALTTSVSSTVKSLLVWTVSRYGYEIRANGEVVATNVSGNWRPEATFDRINGDTQWMAGEILFFPRVLDLAEKEKIEGYLAENWAMQADLPIDHPYRYSKPLGQPGFVLSGIPESAGTYEVSVTATNQWGSITDTFDLVVSPQSPRVQTAEATQVGSTSARLQANVFDLGGMDGNLTFYWDTDSTLSTPNVTSVVNVQEVGFSSFLLTGLSPSQTIHYRAKLENTAGVSHGDAISVTPAHFWELNSSGDAIDGAGSIDGTINGATVINDPDKGKVLSFDGTNDFVDFGDIDEMDQIDRFTLSLWFKRASPSSSQATNHQIDNILVAQSSNRSNDNFEIGTQGSQIEIYVDSGTAATDQTVRVEAGITDNTWYHLALTYGTEMAVYLDGVKVNTWTQYNGRLESSGISSFSLGCARPDRGNPWGDFTGEMHRVQLFYNELSASEIQLLAGLGAVRSFTTESQAVPPIVVTKPAISITDTNATIAYELVSYDGPQPEIILYWGTFDHGENAGLWDYSQSIGNQPAGVGNLQIGGFDSGQTVFYQVQAKGSSYSDWSDISGQFRTVALPSIRSLAAVNQTTSSALLRGEVTSNGGETVMRQLSITVGVE